MNFLAHAYLSFGAPELLIGNLITDFMQGHKKQDYPESIQKGIMLHLEIDRFTDTHPATLAAKDYLRPACGRYCGVFMDVVYDHFLANDRTIFSLASLADFSRTTYETIDRYSAVLPHKFLTVFSHMKSGNWLYNYHTKEEINHAFNGIYHRAKYLSHSNKAYQAFLLHYSHFQAAYRHFMPDMVAHAENFIKKE